MKLLKTFSEIDNVCDISNYKIGTKNLKKVCAKCKIVFQSYWLKNGICNGCKNPHLIVKGKASK